MSRLVGRSDDMLVLRGVNVFPSEIEAILLSSPELGPHYTIVLDSIRPMQTMVVLCERASTAGQSASSEPELATELSARLSERLGVSARVVIGKAGDLPRTEVGKAVRLVRRTRDNPGLPPELVRLMAVR
jgi:phenylacetate-CoA ligase